MNAISDGFFGESLLNCERGKAFKIEELRNYVLLLVKDMCLVVFYIFPFFLLLINLVSLIILTFS